ncbi:hypothetical protein K491DRAFT_294685 [Lophiostoma macrostomum CBS 122681]|uniref:CorA-like transporter domain-containing protein n=1 Tax=Lophiostoma macrostomum CBS 122681 TaxID=1314788 RepID=A0A6A6TGP4_9PLEO|nr:hypothetical protein K491DRAFT_294685 [Lophiostoma macrostomum CBS 122681]
MQPNTWSRLLTSSSSFQSIYSTYGISPAYLDMLQEFGYRNNDEERRYANRFWQAKTGSGNTELYYNIRYLAPNGRAGDNAWSYRHIGVYEQYNPVLRKSYWILIQPSEELMSHFDHLSASSTTDPRPLSNKPCCGFLHTTFMQVASIHWRDYIDEMRDRLEEIDEKASFSSVGRKCKILDFRNNEAMQNHERALQQIATDSRSEGENMVRLARQAARDSKLLKALTMLATLYLPASLLATIFSSNLVVSQLSPSSLRAHFVVASDFWIYIILTLSLTLVTSMLMLWMQRRSARVQ